MNGTMLIHKLLNIELKNYYCYAQRWYMLKIFACSW